MSLCKLNIWVAPIKHWWTEDVLQSLIWGNQQANGDGLWAKQNGALYVWCGSMDKEPREVTLEQAREWWRVFHDPRFEFAAPYFKEDTSAARFVKLVNDAWLIRQAEIERKLSPPDFEDAVRASAALTALLYTHIESPTATTVVPMDRDTFNCGLMLLCQITNDRLLSAYYGESKSRLAALNGVAK